MSLLLVKRSIFTKILLSLLVATIIPFILSNYISYQITGKAINEQLVELNQNSMAITAASLHEYFHDLSLLGLAYYSDPALNRILSSEEVQTPAESVYITQQLERIFARYMEIGSVSYKSALTNKQFNIGTDYSTRVQIPDFRDWRLSRPHEELKGDFQVTRVNQERRLRVNRYFLDITTRNTIGLTTFDVQATQVRELVSALTTSQVSSIYVFIQDDLQLLYAPPGSNESELDWVDDLRERSAGREGVTKGSLLNPEGTYIYYRDVSYDLPVTLVKFVPQSVIDEARSTALGRSLAIQIGAVVLVGAMAAFISYFILHRVERLLQNIKRLQMGDFKLKAPKRNLAPDELDLLEERFHEMALELDRLWNKQYRHQLELSHARLKMLQAQINPHFFYNTLQSIGTLAIKNNAREVSDRLAEFGALFRYSMDIDTEVVYLKEELDHVAHYASLQMGRFKNKLTYAVSCPEEAYDIRMPKMILQPLVENSIVHGLEKGTGYGEIQADIELNDAELRIRVIDNGKGFTPEEIQAIRQRYLNQNPNPAEEQRVGIGLTNVLTRLQLYYGDSFDWDIRSEPYVRTIVTLFIPRNGESYR
ncbi:histidine kinase [Paenibacillus sp.]|uniref:sensor histidine kinase n=1 Tax=Paenibacillus sp. TaxID=58172 RepID=UPI0028111EE7|nr:histidine kinase [Paenibacillus sp.]